MHTDRFYFPKTLFTTNIFILTFISLKDLFEALWMCRPPSRISTHQWFPVCAFYSMTFDELGPSIKLEDDNRLVQVISKRFFANSHQTFLTLKFLFWNLSLFYTLDLKRVECHHLSLVEKQQKVFFPGGF